MGRKRKDRRSMMGIDKKFKFGRTYSASPG
jgi:hypothetical protein